MDTLETAAIEKRRKEVSFFKEHGCQPMNLKGYGFVEQSMETKPTEDFLYQKSNIKEQSGHELKNNPCFSVIKGPSFCKSSTQQLPLGPGNNVNGSSQKEPNLNARRTQKCYEAIPSKLSPGIFAKIWRQTQTYPTKRSVRSPAWKLLLVPKDIQKPMTLGPITSTREVLSLVIINS